MTSHLPGSEERNASTQQYVLGAVGLFLLIALFVCASLLPRRNRWRPTLEELATKVYNYRDVNRCFPPPSIHDANGAPMHSWRAMIVPYLEKNCFSDQYRRDEPWNGPNNRLLHEVGLLPPVDEFMDPTDVCDWFVADPTESYDTRYVMLVRSHRPTQPLSVSVGVRDSSSWKENERVGGGPIIVEMKNTGIHWMQPRDISLDELQLLIADETLSPIIAAAVLSEDGPCQVLKRDQAIHYLRGLVQNEEAREN